MKFAKQHPKMFVCLFILVLVAAGALIVRNIPGAGTGGTTDTGNVAWEISVWNLVYNSATERTSSNHRFLIENSGEETEVVFEFQHAVVTDDGFSNVEVEKKIPDIENNPGYDYPDVPPWTYYEKSESISADVSHLDEGDYKITAYTRISPRRDDDNLSVVDPKVDETSGSFNID